MACSVIVGAVLIIASAMVGAALARPKQVEPPPSLQGTGLYSDFAALEVDPAHLVFAPQYPLWTDGAAKRRWISLPPGTAIDGSEFDAWVFPVGTRFWKEFSFEGKRVETRYLQHLGDGHWLYAAYEWSEDGREAPLAPERGRRGAFPLEGGRSHTIPGVTDCKVCHEAGRSRVLGFSALQLAQNHDPGALHAELRSGQHVDLEYLVESGLLTGVPEWAREAPPRLEAATDIERSVLGYLHGNCGHCHNAEGPQRKLGLFLSSGSGESIDPVISTVVGHPVKKRAPGQSPDIVLRVEPGHPERSALVQRMGSRDAALQMPPLGTELVDREALSLVQQWIAELKAHDAKILSEEPRK